MRNDKKKISIGIIGKGFVGTAVAHGFSSQTGYGAEIRIYDKNKEKTQNSLEDTVNNSEFIFLSVPTPADKNGFNDLSIVRSVLEDIDSVSKNTENIILIRSTVVPGTTKSLQERNKDGLIEKLEPNLVRGFDIASDKIFLAYKLIIQSNVPTEMYNFKIMTPDS